VPFAFDATFKEMVQHYAGDYAALLGLQQLPVQLLNVDLSTLSAATDAALGFGDPLVEIADLNFQSGNDAYLPQRGMLYNAAPGYRYHVPVRSIFILLRPDADHRNLSGILAYNDARHRVEFRYEVVRIWQRSAESFLAGPLGLIPMSVLGELQADRPEEQVIRELVLKIEARLCAETSHAEAVTLMTATFILSGMRLKKLKLIEAFQGVGLMIESAAYEAILDQGIAKGRPEGEIAGRQKMILRLGRVKFGAPIGETIRTIQNIDDVEHLERVGDALLVVSSWDELLATA